MKAIKAYIRCEKVGEVLDGLKEHGIEDISLIHVKGIGHLAHPQDCKYSIEDVTKYSEVGKIEIICRDDQYTNTIETLRQKAYTGMQGDGMIFVTEVMEAVKIRTGETGETAL